MAGTVFNVLDYGAINDASGDSTSAIQAAIDAARAYTSPGIGGRSIAGTVFFPNGIYQVSSLDCTHTAGLELRGEGGAWGVALYADQQTSAGKAVIDFTGSSNCVVRNIHVAGSDAGGVEPSITPTCAFLLAESSTKTSDKMAFYDCRTSGFFSDAALVSFGCTNTNYYSTVWANEKPSGYAAYIGKTNTFSNASAFQTINTTPTAATENKFFGCEFHARDADNTGTVGTVFLDSARTASFHGCLVDNGTAAGEYVRVKGTVEDIGFLGCKFYSETGTATNHVFDLDASATLTRVSVIGSVSDNVPAGNFINGAAGATASLVNVQGWKDPEVKANLAGAFFNPASSILPFSNDGTTLTSGSTLYLGIGRDSATESVVQFAAPRSGVIKRMFVNTNGSPVGQATFTFTLRKNSADTPLAVTLTGSATFGNNVSNEIGVNAGDTLCVRVVASGGSGAAGQVAATVEFGDR